MVPADYERHAAPKALFCRIFKTHLGWCAVVGSKRGICNVILPMSSRKKVQAILRRTWGLERETRGASARHGFLVLSAAERQVKEYLAGKRRAFELPISLPGRGAFERAVYAATKRIPYGKTTTYTRIARKVGRPRAARAVGRAMARNPVPLLVPCHRVVASDGGLCGFTSEGGLELKQALLDLEKYTHQ
jgi:methylated-DNA-[protein]-cysteine S-methyltransferase